MSAIDIYPFRQQAVSPPLSASDNYQWIKFRVFDLTLEHLERQGLDADTMPLAALQDQVAGAISVAQLGSGAGLNQREREAS